MQLSLTETVNGIIRSLIIMPLMFASVFVAILLLVSLVWNDSLQNLAMVQSNEQLLSQLILSGDTPTLKRQLLAMATVGNWKSGAIYHTNHHPLASIGTKESCGNKVYLSDPDKRSVGYLCFERNLTNRYFRLVSILFVFLSFVFTALILAIKKTISSLKTISKRIESLAEAFSEKRLIFESQVHSREEAKLIHSFNEMLVKEEEYRRALLKTEGEVILARVASQVSHDIRSPLAALNMILGYLDQISEDKRVLIRNSVNTINDIANQLLRTGKQHRDGFREVDSKELPTVLVSPFVEYLISEKRTQSKQNAGLIIDSDISQGYGLFIQVDPIELKRAVSNLINNSIEAIENKNGVIAIALRDHGKSVSILVSDNGKGIPEHILKRVGERGFSYGKNGSQSGSGLGLFHAKEVVESFKGKFLIESKEGYGTTITMSFLKAQPPKWFVPKIEVFPNTKIVVLDDDRSIHEIWKSRLLSLNSEQWGVSLISFVFGGDFKLWVQEQKDLTKVLFLMDFELLNQKQTGLDLVEELGLNAILVTSRFEEVSIITRCEALKIGLIPKGMASLIPIEIAKLSVKFDWLLIDDDPLVHMTWELLAKERGIRFRGFFDFEDFNRNIDNIDRTSTVFIDACLANDVRGENVAEKVADLGFVEIFIATGLSVEDIRLSPSIKGVVGKDPPS